jgi:3',5'-cyclic AMP phosphodiesterase CpdA
MNGISCLTKAIRVALLLVTASGCDTAQARVPELTNSDDSIVVAAAGDLVCGTLTPPEIPCLSARTATLLKDLQPNAVFLLGDLQYESGSAADFSAFFDPSFGDLKSITYPVPGNHEYFTRGAQGYFDYFNGVGVDSGRAGSRRRGYYSVDLGAWHIVALNTNCEQIGGCARNSPQLNWLRDDLARSSSRCKLAFAHAGRFSSGEHGSNDLLRDLWSVLQSGGVDVFLAGHDHGYERFKPQDAAGRADEKRGIRSFVVGTGGKGLGRFMRTRPNSEIRDNSSMGVLLVTLRSEDYSWRFVPLPIPGFTLADSGRATCGG